jgi:GDPmannose 4,6-dehydratase
MNSKRDWGYAPEFVEGMWRMLQLDNPDDYVLATGETHTIREFAEQAFHELDMDLEWDGTGVNEVGVEKSSGKTRVTIDPVYYRKTEVDLLVGDSTKAQNDFSWNPQIKFSELVKLMVESDWKKVQKRGF